MPCVLGPLDLDGFDQFRETMPGKLIHLIGFSLGAMTALKIAAKHPETVERLALIAPAAPLELGDFLPRMAGRAVFNAARSGNLAFRVFTAVQHFGAVCAAETIVKAMFKDSPNADKDLFLNPNFKNSLIAGLRRSLGLDNHAYRRAVRTYVKPWAEDLKDIKCPVEIYHGTHDNWAPIEMSQRLIEEMDTQTNLIIYDGLGHYSALHKALPELLCPPEGWG